MKKATNCGKPSNTDKSQKRNNRVRRHQHTGEIQENVLKNRDLIIEVTIGENRNVKVLKTEIEMNRNRINQMKRYIEIIRIQEEIVYDTT